MHVGPLAVSALDEWRGFLLLAGVLVGALLVDLRFFAPRREPTLREGVAWSLGWVAVALLATIPLLLLWGDREGTAGAGAVTYLTVYVIERVLSLDNLFVFLLLFAYFGVPTEQRARLLFWAIVGAAVLRGVAIVLGVGLIEAFSPVVYLLGATLLILAWRVIRGAGSDDETDPGRNPLVRLVRRLYPVTDGYRGGAWTVRERGRRAVTPLVLCLVAIVGSDLAFAVDSIPAAFGITGDPLLIWMGNVFALLGLRAMFVIVDWLVRRFRYLDQTIGVVLGLVGVNLILQQAGVVELPEWASLGVVVGAFGVGVVASVLGDRRDGGRGGGDREEPARDHGTAPATAGGAPAAEGPSSPAR